MYLSLSAQPSINGYPLAGFDLKLLTYLELQFNVHYEQPLITSPFLLQVSSQYALQSICRKSHFYSIYSVDSNCTITWHFFLFLFSVLCKPDIQKSFLLPTCSACVLERIKHVDTCVHLLQTKTWKMSSILLLVVWQFCVDLKHKSISIALPFLLFLSNAHYKKIILYNLMVILIYLGRR